MVYASFIHKIDAETRRFGSKKGLGTQVFHAVNDEWWSLELNFRGVVNMLTIPPCDYD